ncbi:polyadenylate-binding protein-interacting protein 1 isoform X2 [Hypanus sabinus]|uniref:polyadenylate-binding protein-interacting protein 1 isoform X2 n=1 Tax=Hypanus sabinus TaxID=79690 RepID=UPI0028C38743|nr:polyadenylate-binding protein-interacting protein 1 isoform X2 [Hypanus sabinus]
MESGRPPAFDRAPGAGRGRGRGSRAQGHGDGAQENGLCGGGGGGGAGSGPAPLNLTPASGTGSAAPCAPALLQGNGVHVKSGIQQQEPLRQPRSSPPAADFTDSANRGQTTLGSHDQYLSHGTNTALVKPQRAETITIQSKLSASAPEFYPPGFVGVASHLVIDSVSADVMPPSSHFNEHPVINSVSADVMPPSSHFNEVVPDEPYVDFEVFPEPSLSDYLQDFLSLLTSHPGSFELEIVQFTAQMNSCVNTDEALKEVVEIIYQQATTVPNFTYTGARLCNYLSQNLSVNPRDHNFRDLLLERCQKEFKKRGEAAAGDEETRKKFHSFVLFLGELYLNLEVKGVNGTMARADVLVTGLRELLNTLLSQPTDDNLICAMKLLKLTGSILEDFWKKNGKTDMDDVIQQVENVILDSKSSRDIRHMLLKLVELRSSNWGRVHTAVTYNEATPENDPNYYMNEPVFYSAEGIPLTPADPGGGTGA